MRLFVNKGRKAVRYQKPGNPFLSICYLIGMLLHFTACYYAIELWLPHIINYVAPFVYTLANGSDSAVMCIILLFTILGSCVFDVPFAMLWGIGVINLPIRVTMCQEHSGLGFSEETNKGI